MNCVQNGDLTVGEPEGVFLDLCAGLGAERRPKVENDTLEVLETWKGTEGFCESIFKLCDLEFITDACRQYQLFGKGKALHKGLTLSARWKKAKLRMIAWIIDDLAYVGGERRRINDAPTLLCALYAVVDMYLAE